MTMSRGNKTLVIVLCVAGAGALLVVLSCAGLVYLGSQAFAELPKVQSAADRFLGEINAGRVEAAYNSTAPAFQAKVGRKEFQDLVEKFPALRNQARQSVTGLRIQSTPAGTKGTIQYQ